MRRNVNNGFTLLEVLIALVVFSLGLLGVAGLLVVSVQTNHSAYLRTQATFLAQSMADRMHANNLGVWAGAYNVTAAPGSASGCLSSATLATCSAAQIATRDVTIWSNQLASFLPNPVATIACTAPASTPSADKLTERPPYTSTCDVTITWGESALEKGGTAQTESLDWVFQP